MFKVNAIYSTGIACDKVTATDLIRVICLAINRFGNLPINAILVKKNPYITTQEIWVTEDEQKQQSILIPLDKPICRDVMVVPVADSLKGD